MKSLAPCWLDRPLTVVTRCMLVFSVFCSLVLSVETALASDSLQVSSDSDNIAIAPFVTLLKQNDAVTDPASAQGALNRGLIAQSGFTDLVKTTKSNETQWLAFRVSFEDDALRHRSWVLSTQDVMHLTRIILHVPVVVEGQADYRALEDTLHGPVASTQGTTMSNFLIPEDIDTGRPLWLEVSGKLPLGATLLWQSAHASAQQTSVRVALISLLVGSVLGLIGYNLVLYFFLRDKAYLLYVAYATGMVLWLSQVLGYMLFLNKPFGLAYYSLVTPNLSAGLANMAGALFTFVFLRLHLQNQWQGRMVLVVSGSNLLLGVASYGVSDELTFVLLHQLQYVLAGLAALIVVVPTIQLAVKGYRFALPFVLAWGSLGVGIILLSLGFQPRILGVEFPKGMNVLIAMAIEMVLMSYALGLRFQSIRKENHKLDKLSKTDALTGLYNQRYYHDRLNEVVIQPLDDEEVWACAILDVDHFKAFNDQHGHLTGDRVLAQLGRIIQHNIRDRDQGFRIGGEEFSLLLKVRSLEEATGIVERVCAHFSRVEVHNEQGQPLRCSLSAGITLLKSADEKDTLIHRADQALYQAKSQGRDRVVVDAELV